MSLFKPSDITLIEKTKKSGYGAIISHSPSLPTIPSYQSHWFAKKLTETTSQLLDHLTLMNQEKLIVLKSTPKKKFTQQNVLQLRKMSNSTIFCFFCHSGHTWCWCYSHFSFFKCAAKSKVSQRPLCAKLSSLAIQFKQQIP